MQSVRGVLLPISLVYNLVCMPLSAGTLPPANCTHPYSSRLRCMDSMVVCRKVERSMLQQLRSVSATTLVSLTAA
jgi:hypothetical protein